MNPTLRQFRFTVASSLGIQVALFFNSKYGFLPVPDGSTDAFTWNYYGSAFTPELMRSGFWLWLIFNFGSLVGLLFLWRPARYFASLSVLIGILQVGWAGISVSAPIEGLFYQLASVLFLLALGMAYFGATVSACFFWPAQPGANDT